MISLIKLLPMKVKFKGLIVGVGSSIFTAASFIVVGFAIVTIGLFNLILATILELLVLAYSRVVLVMSHGRNTRIDLTPGFQSLRQ